MVSANHWLRGIETYRLSWYLTRISANHASSNWAQLHWLRTPFSRLEGVRSRELPLYLNTLSSRVKTDTKFTDLPQTSSRETKKSFTGFGYPLILSLNITAIKQMTEKTEKYLPTRQTHSQYYRACTNDYP